MLIKHVSTLAALGLCLALACPAHAADPTTPDLKAEIDAIIHRLEGGLHGMAKWDGAEKMDVHQDGDASVAEITNARILFQPPPGNEPAADKARPSGPAAKQAQLVLDRIEIRRTPAANDALDLAIKLPHEAVLHLADDEEVRLALKDPTIHAILDAKTERTRELSLDMAGARFDDKKSSSWMTLGPYTGTYKVVPGDNGGWTAPSTSEVKGIEFFIAKGPISGTLDRVSANGESAGPDLAAIDRVRDQINAMQQTDLPPAARSQAFLGLLPDMLSQYSLSKAEVTLEGLTARAATGAPLGSLTKATFGVSFSGLSQDSANLRITLKHEGLALGPTVPSAYRVPQRAVFDIALEDVSSGVLRNMLETLSKMSKAANGPEKQQLMQQVMGAAAGLTPVLRLYDFAFDTRDFGVDAKAEAKGFPLSPKGYHAQGDITVRSLDVLPKLFGESGGVKYVPLLEELGKTSNNADGIPLTRFHLVSEPPKWIEVNGNNISDWFIASPPGGPRRLRLADPPMTGSDVLAVQRALIAKKVPGAPASPSDSYDSATALAVAHFQKQSALNVDGVVDQTTADKLGVTLASTPPAAGARPAPPGGPNAAGPNQGAPKAPPARPN